MAILFVQPADSSTVIFCDANDVAFGGFSASLDRVKASGMFTSEDLGQSSTYRELKAIYYVLLSFAEKLQQKRVKVFTDNQGAARIVSVGSSKVHLQSVDVLISGIWSDAAALEDPLLRSLVPHLLDLQLGSRAPSTLTTYKSGWLRGRGWASSKIGVPVIPAKTLHIALFITGLTNVCLANNTGVSPIEAVVYGIKWAHSMAGLEICPANHPLVKSSFEGAKRKLARPVSPKEPLSIDTLQAFAECYVSSQYKAREFDTLIKEKPTKRDLDNINQALAELMRQQKVLPTDNPFTYLWIASCVPYSVVIAFLLYKGWKKKGPKRPSAGESKQQKRRRLYVEKYEEEYPAWFCEGKTTLIPKPGEFTSDNQRPITCLNTLYKWFTSCLLVTTNQHLEENDLMEGAQRGARAGFSGTIDNLLIDRTVALDCHRRRRNLSMAWIDVKKAYDSVDHSWLNGVMTLLKFPTWLCKVIAKLCKSWNTKVVAITREGRQTSERIKFNRGLPQGDALCLRLFTVCLNPVAWKIRAEGYRMSKPINSKVTGLVYIDDIKIFAASESKLERVMKMVKSSMEDVGLQWNLKRCAVARVKRGVQVTAFSGGRVVESTRIPCLDDGERYKFLGVLESVRQEDKLVLECAAREYLRRLSIFKEAAKCAEELGLELDLEHAQGIKKEVRRCQIEKLEDEIRNQRWQGRLVTTRLEDESLSADGCFWWLTEWKNCPSHTIAGLVELYEQLLPTRVYTSQKTHTSGEGEVRCRLCGKAPESVAHILSGCSALAQSKYLSRHDAALKVLFYQLLYDEGFIDEIPPWYSPDKPKPVYESENVKAYWDVPIYADQQEVRCNRVDARIVNHMCKRVVTLEMSCPWVNNRTRKDEEKTLKYGPLRWELRQQFPGYEVKQYNIIMDALGGWSRELDVMMRELVGGRSTDVLRKMQRAVLSGTLNIARTFKEAV
ncbi:Retrovirus-related Pol polyprotein from type-1 retrotransposable element R2 [Stylophora pistillata]|uniref:Retrovirus-related Pol polyprotein from type-1 retrotransposable element R2 n=1 Tax=Stylophora pistillata TaxID=50429 RepID=A0A2B4SQ98_STYPI|nr:Retrovirus-related Pol polyprotein from type-1 retrotransposable element R2 [Stylophora pistillata]